MNLRFEPLKPEHASIAHHLRQADIDEINAMSGLPPDIAVSYSIAHSERGCAAILNNKPAAIFGVSSPLIWLVGTDEITRHPVTFFKLSEIVLAIISLGYHFLENYVDARNSMSLRWLKRLGFHIDEPQILGVEQRPFHHVWLKENDSCARS